MPSKALLQPADLAHRLGTAAALGVRCAGGGLDFGAVMARKRALVEDFAAARRRELRTARGVTLLRGRARLDGPRAVLFRSALGEAGGVEAEPALSAAEQRLSAGKVIVAAGSASETPALPGLAAAGYLTSATALELAAPPESLVVLGAGPVGLELGQFYARAGSRVTLVGRGPGLLADADPAAGEALAAAFRREGIDVLTGATAVRVARDPDGRRRLSLSVEDGPHGPAGAREVVAAALLVAAGRRARLDGLGLEGAGVALTASDSGDVIEVDATMRSRHPDVYAAGDVAGPRQATHLAVLQGEVAGYNAARDLGFDGGAGAALAPGGPDGRPLGGTVRGGPDGRLRMDYAVQPEVLFTDPGFARVGLSETGAAAAGIACVATRYPFSEVGMATVMGQTEGYLKLLARREDGRLVGAEVLGAQAETLVHEAVLALAFGATAAQLARLPHYHPTLSEVFPAAAEALLDRLGA